jgi:hypothetical protein
MGQNLSNDVQDKTADISGSGRKPKFGLSAGISHAGGKAEWDKTTPAGCLEACPIDGFLCLATKENIFLLGYVSKCGRIPCS